MPPRENGLGVPGQAASDAQHLQNVRQRGANAAGQQIYNNPTTAAGMDAQHKWNQNNPIPKQSLDTVYGGVNYGNKLQKDTEVAVDQEQIGRGGPGTGNAMIRAGLLDANGYKPGTNSRDTRSESAQHSQHNSVMADIKREQSNGGIQNSRVNTINPSRPVDINGDRRRTEAKNGWPKGSMDQGGTNYGENGKRSAQLVQQNGPTGVPPVPLAAPTPAPVAKTTPAPTGYQWQSKEAEALYNKSFVPGQYNGTPGSNDPTIQRAKNLGVLRPDGSYDFNAARAAGSQVTPPEVDLLNKQNQAPTTGGGVPPNQNSAMAEFQAKNNARMKAEGSTRPPDDYTKLGAGEQKYVTDFNMERGNIPRPVRPPTGQVPNPRNPNKDMNDRPMVPKKTNSLPPVQPPKPVEPQQPPVAQKPPVPKKTFQNLVVEENPEELVAPAPKVPPKFMEGVDKMPTIRKSNPIADTIKASNNPVPVVDTPKPTQKAPAKKKPLFPRLRGRR